jgi:hypothetical protein
VYLDFIVCDFLYEITSQPESYELKTVLSIAKEDVEARHEYMLPIIEDRVKNKAKYEQKQQNR